jgi:hypothetical protein
VDNGEEKIYKFPSYIFPFHQIHELADQYPIMSEEERAELEHSLITTGQINPITLYKGKIIDGRNRYLVLKELFGKGQLKFKPKFQEYKGSTANLQNVVEALNVHRRHLSTSQKAAIGVKRHLQEQKQLALERQEKGVSLKVGEGGGKTSEAIAKIAGVSTTYIEKAMKVMQDNKMFSYLENGKLNIVDAEIIVSHATPEQKEEIIRMIEYKNALGLKYRISTIKPKKNQLNKKVINKENVTDEPDLQMPAIIVFQKLDLDDDNAQLIKEKIQELNFIMESANKGKSVEIWYKPNLELKGGVETLYKKWKPVRFKNGEQI